MSTDKNERPSIQMCSTSSMIAAVAVLVAIAAIFVAGMMYAKVGKVEQAPPAPAPQPAQPQAPQGPTPDLNRLQIRDNDVVRGSSDILLIEYSDYECPFCQRFHATAQALVDSGEVAWVYRHLPLAFHATAKEGSLIAECVRLNQGAEAFWSYTDGVFNAAALDLETYKSLARTQGLSDAQIDTCLAPNSEAQKTVDQHFQDTQVMGVNGTPGSFLVNTKTNATEVIPGALPVEEIRRMLSTIQ